jgi:S1-C subfamily serine protease
MRLDSVRELKRLLPLHLERVFATRRMAARRDGSTAVAVAASRRRVTPSYFLGVSAKGRKSYRLAVRLQDHALERSSLVETITQRARGEVDVRYVGQIRSRATATAMATKKWYRSRTRPLRIGASVGFLMRDYVMAGTLGCFVRRKRSSARYILSNNHVLADENRYKKGGTITQPGPLDGGTPGADTVAKLAAFVALDPDGTNHVDCAIARLANKVAADTRRLRGIGRLAGLANAEVEIGDVVHKVGRTTGVTHGRVTAVEMDGVTVQYDIGYVSFDGQIEIEGAGTRSFSNSGDSGSLIVNDDMEAVGLLFAGGDHGGSNGKGLTYGNPIQAVLSALKVQLA